ncbi:transport and Golgi organization protein 1 [Onthophagus taurus]|uniref:transport and Golgi organization protein 1 n=1 Tax=Onthophagus taurus TaxID=166361 RepID=UPI0039BE10FA
MFTLKLLFLVILAVIPQNVISNISDKRLCANQECTERISLARTVLRYNSPEKGLLSVPQNKEVIVFSKSAGSNMDLWGVEYNGKRGYLNKKFLRETRIFKKELPFLVDTEFAKLEKVPSSDHSEDILPNQQTEVIDGTTITLSPNDINPSATQENVKPTESVLNTLNEESENEDDDEGDDDDEDGEDDEDQEEEVQIIDDPIITVHKGEINGSDESKGEKEYGMDIKSQEDIITKGSITSRSLLQHDEEIVSTDDVFKKETVNSEDDIVDNPKSEEVIKESVVVTTENVLDVPFNDDSAKIETVTENPGLLKENDEDVKNSSDDSFWGFGLGNIQKEINAIFEDEGNELEKNASEENNVQNSHEEVPKEENIPSVSIQIENNNENVDVKAESTENIEQVNENHKIEVEDDTKKENSLLESVQIDNNDIVKSENVEGNDENMNITVEEPKKEDTPLELDSVEEADVNVGMVEIENLDKIDENNNIIVKDVLKEENTQIKEVKENLDTVKIENSDDSEKNNEINLNVLSENPSQFEPITPINTDFDPQKIIQDTQTPNIVEDINVEIPIPENTIIPETPIIDNINNNINQDLIQNEIPSLNENLDLIQNNQEFVPNIAEDHHSINTTPENPSENLELDSEKESDSGGWYNSFFGTTEDAHGNENVVEEPNLQENVEENVVSSEQTEHEHNIWTNPFHSSKEELNSEPPSVEEIDSCSTNADDCSNFLGTIQNQLDMDFSSINFSDILNLITVLGITGISIVIFLLGYIAIDKSRRETPLVAKINKLEKALLISTKENQILKEQVAESESESKEQDVVTSKIYTELEDCNRQLMAAKTILEDQVQSLEKELENSTEVGFELNRMLSEILKSQSGSDMLVANIENLQRQLVEQQGTINSINATLNLKDTENHELQLELEIKNKKVIDLQAELDKMALSLLKVEEEKDQMQSKLEIELQKMKEELNNTKISFGGNKNKLTEEINSYKKRLGELQKSFDLKSSEYNILKENFNQIKSIKNNQEVMKDLLQSVTSKAELAELQKENNNLNQLLVQERQIKVSLEERAQDILKEMNVCKEKYDEVDKEKLEAQTKLEVLGNYFKEREAELQKELAKQEALWQEKQGEATSSTERIRYIKEELQNYKSQNELLKQEIVSQEVELKSQISVLEKKAHESWLSARQAERRLEDAKQEAAQLRNRLTLKERSFTEDKGQHRVQSPLEQNGEIIESPASPPLLYTTPHDHHLTTSPGPLPPGLPPFLPPPPPGVPPFMPPPIPGVPGFMPPPPSMFPVDHRPPPLGRMSSPPLNSRYSPDSSRYSDRYDDRNNSPSPPPYDEDDRYGPVSPPPRHGRPYSPYRNDRREYKRPSVGGGRINGRNKGDASSGSENSNSETIDRTNRHHTKI